ncbi:MULTISPECIES: hypothetical protein [Pseudomonas]|jgi:hypothetical protein|uniref:hypothetical protein n=1 Tax=Pseudomonas TaxID=286 RepID=UPI000486C19D|nr:MULTISPECIES: hypothetical protein [Pseudomonas]PRA47343.1 hypothetical protein CQZ98_22820 [Pseudomonas sp. MYb115]QXN47894.1 hypothetical protein KW062_16475 [Pseudomonas fluorescens]WSO22202.1 hypothetical protein VUJ50_16570 [Pseudomonas fluorescens]
MTRRLIVGVSLLAVGVVSFALLQWIVVVPPRHDALCSDARQALKGVEIRARAMAAGLSLDDYTQEEEAKVAALIRALDSAHSEAEVNAVIDAHAAAIESQVAALDAEVDTRGDQVFLEQRLVKQRIPVDVKLELQRAAKAVNLACN